MGYPKNQHALAGAEILKRGRWCAVVGSELLSWPGIYGILPFTATPSQKNRLPIRLWTFGHIGAANRMRYRGDSGTQRSPAPKAWEGLAARWGVIPSKDAGDRSAIFTDRLGSKRRVGSGGLVR